MAEQPGPSSVSTSWWPMADGSAVLEDIPADDRVPFVEMIVDFGSRLRRAVVVGVHRVAGVVDDVGVVAVAALHQIGSGAAVEQVGAVIAAQDVVELVAGRVDRRRSGQEQFLDPGADGVADRAEHPVDAAR